MADPEDAAECDEAAYKPPETTPRSARDVEDELKSIRGLTQRQEKIIGKHTLLPRHLHTGFGIHTDRSLELALKASQGPVHVCQCVQCHGDSLDSSSEGSSHTHGTGTTYAQNQLKFLMGLEDDAEEECAGGKGVAAVEEEEDLINGGSEAMRRAQRYLREHRIFEFYQFLIAHLLSANAFDPVNFLINLLDRCLIYRSGMAQPPLLYDKKHIECLFNLMDRMRSGFIDRQQYETGMLSLGIKSFDQNPLTNSEGLVPKSFFIEEAHECLKDLLNDMIRKRPQLQKGKKTPKAPPPTTNCSMVDFYKT